MKKETVDTIVRLVEDRAAAHAKIAELERQLARERDEVEQIREESKEIATASDEATILLEKGVAELKRQLAEACRDASAPAAQGNSESAAEVERQRDEAREELARLVLTRDTEAEKRTQRLAGELSAAIARAEKAERELAAAWDAYPYRGAVRGMVSLADVIEGLVGEREDRRAELEAALRPDGWECSLSLGELAKVTRDLGLVATENAIETMRDTVLANLRRKGGAP